MSTQHHLSCVRVSRFLSSLAGLCVLATASRVAFSGAAEDYAVAWGPQEKSAVTATERIALAKDLMQSVENTAYPRPATRVGARPVYFSQLGPIRGLTDAQKEEVLFLCQKVYALGAQQGDTYGMAARALGIIESIDPTQRVDCLTKLAKLYATEYNKNPTENVGMAMGLARTKLLIGRERGEQLDALQKIQPLAPEEFGKQSRAINDVYMEGLQAIRPAISNVKSALAASDAPPPMARPVQITPGGQVVAGAPARVNKLAPSVAQRYRAFVTDATAIETELSKGAEEMQDGMRKAATVISARKIVASMMDRLKKNPEDKLAADRIARLYFNELGDDDALHAILPQASPALRDAIALSAKPLDKLSAAEAFAVAKWIDDTNTNPDSPARIDLLIRTRAYLQRCIDASEATASEHRLAMTQLTRTNAELQKVPVEVVEADRRMVAYIDSRSPLVAVAAVPAPTPAAPAGVARIPEAAPPVSSSGSAVPAVAPPVTPAAKTEPPATNRQVAAATEPRRDQASADDAWARYQKSLKDDRQAPSSTNRPSIFDFGREGL